MKTNPLQFALIQAIASAGANAHMRQAGVKVARKGTGKDTVTIVDGENERNIKRELRKVDPRISFIGEETRKLKGTGTTLVVVDPLDATTNFGLGRKEFTVMGQIFEDGKPTFAVISVPVFGELLIAKKDHGVIRRTKAGDERIQISEPASLAEAVISCNRSNYPDEASMQLGLRIIEMLMRNARSWRNFGTAGYEYTEVARGRLDGVVTPIAEAVHAAGHFMMQEAGATVTDEQGRPWALDSRMIVAAHPRIHDALLRGVEQAIKQPE